MSAVSSARRKSWSLEAPRLRGFREDKWENTFAKCWTVIKAELWSCEVVAEGLSSEKVKHWFLYVEAPVGWTCSPDVVEVWETLRRGGGGVVFAARTKLRRQRVKGTSPLVYSDSYPSLSFVCQCRDLVTAVPLTSLMWWPFWTLRVGNHFGHILSYMVAFINVYECVCIQCQWDPENNLWFWTKEAMSSSWNYESFICFIE